jgi:hypothetical protein
VGKILSDAAKLAGRAVENGGVSLHRKKMGIGAARLVTIVSDTLDVRDIQQAVVRFVRPDELQRLGFADAKAFAAILNEARSALKHKALSIDSWLGKAWELIANRLPTVQRLEEYAVSQYLRAVHRLANAPPSALTFINGYGEPAGIMGRFTKVERVYDMRIRRPGQDVGSEFVDRGYLISNSAGQKVFVSREYKTAGAAGDMRGQQGERDERFLYYRPGKGGAREPEGSVLTYSVEGGQGGQSTNLENIILMRDEKQIHLPRQEDFFSRIGIIAGVRPKIAIADTKAGVKYIRVKYPYSTRLLRNVMERVLRELPGASKAR